MTSFLDRLPPYDFADPAARELWGLLATNYQSKQVVRDLLTRDDVDTSEIDWDQPMRWVWHDILDLTFRRDRLVPLLVLIKEGGDASISTRIEELVAAAPVTAPPDPRGAEPVWRGFGDPGMEKVLAAESTFLDIAFLRRGLELGGAVCRLLVTLSGTDYYGTAFRIGADRVLTNHHVLFDHDHGNARATKVVAWFGYERSFEGLTAAPIALMGDPASIIGDVTHDWAVITLKGKMPKTAVTIPLASAAPVGVDDRVYIIQHPNGAPKKIGMIHNVVRFVDDDVVQYLTDTDGGSSGAPVFNEKWELVALHHRWVEAKSNGVAEIRNQGRRIARVVEGLTAAKVI
ncbi:trypsin-like serine peptidase [Microbacterium sp. B2969]|uniref:Trypsin-like serine peptidase n=1 Tax=Microbacterium alkaliflavum TaxID=3248839 RepID=A0ABW7Q5P2_9MICO